MQNCRSFFKNLIIEEILDSDNYEAMFRVTKNDKIYSMKLMRKDDDSTYELNSILRINTEIVNKNLCFCFPKLHEYTICNERVDIIEDYLETSEPKIAYTFNEGSYFLNKIPTQLSHYELKSLIFELLYAIYVIQEVLELSLGIKLDNILVSANKVDRIYTVNRSQIRIVSEYLPIYTDLKPSKDPIGDLLFAISYFMNLNVDLSEKLVAEFALLVSTLTKNKNIPEVIESTFFDDLRNQRIVENLKHDDYTVISEI